MANRVLGRGLQAAALLLGCATVRTEPLHVAVVGGGIGGASAAWFLNEEAQARGLELNITLMERSPQIGGRTHTIDFGGLRIDAGATAISTLNEYLVGFVAKWGFDTDADDDEAGGEAAGEGEGEGVGEAAPADELGRAARFGIWDGESFRVDTREGLALPLTVAERYGLSPLRSVSAVREAAGGLGLIYAMQAEGRWFSSPSEMFAALGILNFTQVTAYDFFEGIGVDKDFVLEFVDGASRDNYNQAGNINAFVDLVSLAGAGIDGSVFSLTNGTAQITEHLARESGATVLVNANVTRVESVEGQEGRVRISWRGGAGDTHEPSSSSSSRDFDAVVIATPLELAGDLEIELSGSDGNIVRNRPYQTTHTTFVDGTLSPTYFDISAARPHPYDILTMELEGVEFSSAGYHGAGTARGASIYKLFSRVELDDETLDRIFSARSATERLVWRGAYPVLDPVDDKAWPGFDLNSNDGGGGAPRAPVMYVNAMESPVSCMETEIISAKNAALRIADALGGKRGASSKYQRW